MRDKSFVEKWFKIIFVIVFAMIILQFVAYGVIGYKLIEVFQTSDAKEVAKELGEVVKSFNSGMNQ